MGFLGTTRDINIFYGNSILKQQKHFKYLGVVVVEPLSWNNHVFYVASRVSVPSPNILLNIYKVTILPILDYGCTVWGFCSKKNSDFLERLQNKAMRIILRTNHLTCTQFMREKLGLLTLFNRRRYMRLKGYFVLRSDLPGKVLRDNRELLLPRTKTAMGQCTFMYASAKECVTHTRR